MSNIFITDIVGTGTYAIPSNDTELANATTGFDGILSGVASLAYDRVLAWVEDAGGPGGSEGLRTLCCLVEKFTYLTKECPSETEVDTMTGAIEAALEADANITSVDQQQVHIFQAGAYFLWNRDSSGFLYPTTTTDDVAVGGHVSPNGKWFDDGDLVLGGNTMTGTERLKVVGSVLVDQDSDGYGIDIDSEATGSPLINLQPTNGNSRGDIAFGTARAADPSGPAEGDLWYDSTTEELRFRRSAQSVPVRDAISLQSYAVDTTAPTDQYVLAWDSGNSQWEPTDLNALPGSYGDEATSTTTTTTTSTSDVLMSGMTLTPPAGTYWVISSCDLEHSNNGRSIWISIYVDGVQIAHSERRIRSPRWNNASWEGFTQAIVTVDGTDAVELRWRTNNNTATANNRAIGVMRIS